MKKSKLVLIAIAVLLAMSVGMLAGCEVAVDHEDGFKLMKENYEASIAYEIFYSKELTNNNVDKAFTRVNSVCNLDKKDKYAKNSDGTYVNHVVNVYTEHNGQMQSEVMVGLSKDGKKDPGKNLKFMTTFTGVNDKKEAQYDKQYYAMTPAEYIKSEEFEEYALATKLSEIGRIKREDMVFAEKKGVVRTGELTNLRFALTEDYYAKYLAEFEKESTLKGTYVTMELVYGRIANITVMQEETGTESIFGVSEYETYKIEIVYLGPKLTAPNYNAVDAKKNKIWTEVK